MIVVRLARRTFGRLDLCYGRCCWWLGAFFINACDFLRRSIDAQANSVRFDDSDPRFLIVESHLDSRARGLRFLNYQLTRHVLVAITAINAAGEGKSACPIRSELDSPGLFCCNLHINVELFDRESVFHVFRGDNKPDWLAL